MPYDFNAFEKAAWQYVEEGRFAEAIKVYLFMADGDNSLDGGWLGWRLGVCDEGLEDWHAAYFWHGRAIEENPTIRQGSHEARDRLRPLVDIDDLVPGQGHIERLP